jgi:mannose-6-phosphate isomerase-like protein (cupin superfamily)
MVSMTYTRISTGADGTSHFEERHEDLAERDFAPPAPALFLSAFHPAELFAFCRFPAGWLGDWHPTPRRQVFFLLAGRIEVTAGDGEVRLLGPGSIVLLEDTGGTGHISRVIGTEDVLAAVVQLPD